MPELRAKLLGTHNPTAAFFEAARNHDRRAPLVSARGVGYDRGFGGIPVGGGGGCGVGADAPGGLLTAPGGSELLGAATTIPRRSLYLRQHAGHRHSTMNDPSGSRRRESRQPN